jgi:pimeloyl-ACP methyl ester carboxylesterase
VATVLVHGHPETAEIWNPIIPLLGRDVITPRLPGYGCPLPAGFGADEFFRAHAYSLMLVRWTAGSSDLQVPHAEDEVWCPPFGSQGATA